MYGTSSGYTSIQGRVILDQGMLCTLHIHEIVADHCIVFWNASMEHLEFATLTTDRPSPKQGVSVKEGSEPYTYVTETGETYEVQSVTFKFGKKVEVSPIG
jgi:hypothetical protein